jgi:hypothetical protein
MKKRIGLAAVSCLILASPAAAATPKEALTGGGISHIGTTFGFTASDGPKGPTGHAVFKNTVDPTPREGRKGEVYCLNVDGNQATFGVIDENKNGAPVKREFFVQDNGNPGRKRDSDLLTEIVTSNCKTPPSAILSGLDDATIASFEIQNGNIVVRDD